MVLIRGFERSISLSGQMLGRLSFGALIGLKSSPGRARRVRPGRGRRTWMEVPMTSKSDNSRSSDVALLASWREWLSALEAEMSATNERDEKRRHVRVRSYSAHHH